MGACKIRQEQCPNPLEDKLTNVARAAFSTPQEQRVCACVNGILCNSDTAYREQRACVNDGFGIVRHSVAAL